MKSVMMLLAIVSLGLWTKAVSADQYNITLDLAKLCSGQVTPLPGGILWLDISLYDLNSFLTVDDDSYDPSRSGDSWAFVDNVVLRGDSGVSAQDTFETDLGDFVDWWSTGYVSAQNGVMEIHEELGYWSGTPTSASRMYTVGSSLEGLTLSLYVEANLSANAGWQGLDQLVISLWDKGWNPLTPARDVSDPDFDPSQDVVWFAGDVLLLDAGGFSTHPNPAFVGATDVQVVPLPGAVLLGVLGFGSAGLGLRRRLARS